MKSRTPSTLNAPVITICDADPMLRLLAIALRGAIGDDALWLTRYFSPEPVDLRNVEAIGARHGLGKAEVRALSAEQEPYLASIGAGSDVFICRRAKIGAYELASSPRIRRVLRLGSDPTGIDQGAVEGAGADVICMDRPSLAFTAEHAVLLMLAAAKNLVEADRLCRDPNWDRARVFPMGDVAYNWTGLTGLGGLYGATIGLIGLGQVGLLVAERLRAFGVKLLYTKRSRLASDQEDLLGLRYVSQSELLATSDVVSLHARWTPQTEGMMNADAFAMMKPGAHFINTSRGILVDEVALADALRSGHIGFAALDAHQPEPRNSASPLHNAPRTIFTSHIAGGSRSVLLSEVEAMAEKAAEVLG